MKKSRPRTNCPYVVIAPPDRTQPYQTVFDCESQLKLSQNEQKMILTELRTKLSKSEENLEQIKVKNQLLSVAVRKLSKNDRDLNEMRAKNQSLALSLEDARVKMSRKDQDLNEMQAKNQSVSVSLNDALLKLSQKDRDLGEMQSRNQSLSLSLNDARVKISLKDQELVQMGKANQELNERLVELRGKHQLLLRELNELRGKNQSVSLELEKARAGILEKDRELNEMRRKNQLLLEAQAKMSQPGSVITPFVKKEYDEKLLQAGEQIIRLTKRAQLAEAELKTKSRSTSADLQQQQQFVLLNQTVSDLDKTVQRLQVEKMDCLKDCQRSKDKLVAEFERKLAERTQETLRLENALEKSRVESEAKGQKMVKVGQVNLQRCLEETKDCEREKLVALSALEACRNRMRNLENDIRHETDQFQTLKVAVDKLVKLWANVIDLAAQKQVMQSLTQISSNPSVTAFARDFQLLDEHISELEILSQPPKAGGAARYFQPKIKLFLPQPKTRRRGASNRSKLLF